jgi:hypothetical protein
MDFWGIGMDLKHGDDIDSFRTYQNKVLKECVDGRRVPFRVVERPAVDRFRTSCAAGGGVPRAGRKAPEPVLSVVKG